MVRFGHSVFDQFIAYRHGKGNIYEAIAMDVTNFAVPHAVLGTAKTMRRMFDSFPARNLDMNFLCSTLHRHDFYSPSLTNSVRSLIVGCPVGWARYLQLFSRLNRVVSSGDDGHHAENGEGKRRVARELHLGFC